MGDKKENEHISIPMAVHESSYQPLLPSENASPEIMLDETSQLTPSADASSTAEPPPSVDAHHRKLTNQKTTSGQLEIFAYVTEDTADDHGEDEGRKQPIYLKVQEF
ncbi:hypothetical protein Ancab_012441 [Ancistrocladus abbreviatus]